jgi:cellulose synthase/poly-beta-1,6-N-acetylglucosamine synthase-like glycosyltransferase
MLVVPIVILMYSLVIYPAILWLLLRRVRAAAEHVDAPWPFVTIVVPAYNEEESIGNTISALLAMDYPTEMRKVLVVSDASTDNTDEIVRTFHGSGVQLLRLSARSGKTAAENAAAACAHGEIIVNIDASVRVPPGSLRPLIRSFRDPSVGVASGRDISVGGDSAESNQGESGYVGYEMWLRGLETRLHSIIGASGCFFATRSILYSAQFPEELSRDFASALIAREAGYRAVSVDDAVCLVPRTTSLRAEFRRKVRTMSRGLATLEYKRALLDFERYGLFAWMLFSHKLCRWLYYLALPLWFLAAILLSMARPAFVYLLVGALALFAVGAVAVIQSERSKVPRALTIPGYILASNLAGVLAWWKYLAGERQSIWDPTRRP